MTIPTTAVVLVLLFSRWPTTVKPDFLSPYPLMRTPYDPRTTAPNARIPICAQTAYRYFKIIPKICSGQICITYILHNESTSTTKRHWWVGPLRKHSYGTSQSTPLLADIQPKPVTTFLLVHNPYRATWSI